MDTVAQTVVRLENVSKTYGAGETAVEAVRDVSLDLEAGKFFMLMGPSGSGKTTLLMLMGCLLKPTTGSVSLFDEDVSSLDEARLPRENVEATLNIKGVRGEEAVEQAESYSLASVWQSASITCPKT
ncbi:MAG: ATP-binding cassette domain-containing protein [Acidobacteriia bacterium]|nr:ATP-binding cassette domain-containing protein [Terriglobia bacterium]